MSATSVVDVDWEAAEVVAKRLGVHTRRLVAERNVERAKDWCVRLARETNDCANARRSSSYFELAVLLGHREPAIDDGFSREWRELVPEIQKLAAAVTVKAKAEEAAARAEAEAAAKAAAEAAEAEAAEGEAEAVEEFEDEGTEDGKHDDPDRQDEVVEEESEEEEALPF